VRDDVDLHTARLHCQLYWIESRRRLAHLHQAPAPRLTARDSSIHNVFHVPLQPLPKVLEHRASTRQHNVLVQSSSDIDGTGLDDGVDDLGERGEEVGRVDFGVKEDFWGEETLVSDVDIVFLYVSYETSSSAK
jgi:hypothetical protein